MKLSKTFSKWLFEFALLKEQRENYSYPFVEKTIYYSLLSAESEQK